MLASEQSSAPDQSYPSCTRRAHVPSCGHAKCRIRHLGSAQNIDRIERIFTNEKGVKQLMAQNNEQRRRYFCDPSLAAALLGATPQRLLGDMQTLGLLFESLVMRDLRVFLSTYPGLGNGLYYYRDKKGLEVDAIMGGHRGQTQRHEGRRGGTESPGIASQGAGKWRFPEFRAGVPCSRCWPGDFGLPAR